MKSTKIQSNMRTRITLIICLCLFAVGRASAQWAVIDPSNIAQSIVNTSKNVVHTSTTAQNMIKNFQETVKIYEQGKKYYDALKSVNNLVKDARKVHVEHTMFRSFLPREDSVPASISGSFCLLLPLHDKWYYISA